MLEIFWCKMSALFGAKTLNFLKVMVCLNR